VYRNLQMLSFEKHASLQLKQCSSFSFASHLTSIHLAFGEIIESAKYYPIVFTDSEIPMLMGIVGVGGNNSFIDHQGKWLVPYVPAIIRTYPFALLPTNTQNQYSVAIDVDAPHFLEEEGQFLFDAEGKTAPWVDQLIKYLLNMQREYQVSQAVGTSLKKAGLIAQRCVEITLKNGKRKGFQGFLCVDETAVNALPEERKKDMESNGEMTLLKAHRDSLIHFDKFFE